MREINRPAAGRLPCIANVDRAIDGQYRCAAPQNEPIAPLLVRPQVSVMEIAGKNSLRFRPRLP